ncbi:DUF4395 domain-containing protein [Cryobacterium sp. TMT1-62]|nr:DUF4395 domain-containing protein [Cryobacterium sp. TMT1-62]
MRCLKKRRIAPVCEMGLPMASIKESKVAALRELTKTNLDKQGFGGLDDEAKSCYAWPLRFTPAVGTVLIVLGLILQSSIILGLGAIVPLTGALFPRGMILDLVYNLVVRHMFRAPALPPTPSPRRFSYLLSTVLLAGAALSFYFGLSALGIVLGGMVALGGTILTTTHWCLGSWLYRLILPHATAR